MRTLTVALGFLIMAALVTGHVDSRSTTRESDRVPASVAGNLMPAAAPAGVEVLLQVR